MLEISADKIAFVVLRARDFDQGLDGRGGRNAFELHEFIENLNDDEQAALTAVMWIGRGTFDPDDLAEAMATARTEKTTPTADYLMGTPHVSDYLEAGMTALGLDATRAEDDLLKF